jgi:hypothetical protein
MSPTPPHAAPQSGAPAMSEETLRQGAEHVHRETELAWLHSNELPVQVLLIPAVGQPVGLCVDLWQPRAVGEAVIRQAAAGLDAEAIIACLHIGDLYLDGESHGVFGAQPPVPLGTGPLRGEAIITVAVWPSRAYVACLISDAYADDHGTRLLPPREAVPGPASAATAPLDLPLVAWLAGMLPGPNNAGRSPS